MKILKLNSSPARSLLIAVAVAAVLFWLYFARLDLAASLAYKGIDSRQPEARALADWLVDTAPGDPNSYVAAAKYLQGTFEPGDLERSLNYYERAVELTPQNFYLWQILGSGRDRAGDEAGAEAAFAQALTLAPNYAAVQWAYGNSLIRHGKQNEGFALISKAAASDTNFAGPAASIALQALGDPDEVRRVLGSGAMTNASIANVLASQKKYSAAYEAWAKIEPGDKTTVAKDVGVRLLTLAADARETRIASAIFGDLYSANGERPVTGQVYNGGFESGLKLRNAGLFEWQIGEGTDPQFGLSEGTKRSGNYSLLLTFNAFEASSFRPILQRIAVEPGATYEFEAYYRADLKTKADFKWEIVDLRSSSVLASTEPLKISGDWASLHAKFTMPAESDGIILQLARTGCVGAVCPVSGKVLFDDLGLKRT